ncbi:MAG: hypothetical protein AAFY36_10650 [Bacteroidota bacterium]
MNNAKLYWIWIVLMLYAQGSLVSCENNYNIMVSWSEQIPVGTHMDTVKANTPSGVVVNWQRADTIQDEVYYEVYVKNNYDILGMQNFLVFYSDRFVRRSAIK